MNARANILRRVRAALGVDGSRDTARAAASATKLSSHPRGPLPEMQWDRIARFKERCMGLSSTVDEVASYDGVPEAIARYVRTHSLPPGISCWTEFSSLPWKEAGLEVEFRSAHANDKIGITGCYCAVAETGTLMSLSAPVTPLTSSLLPDTHIAIVPESRVLLCMEEAWDLLRKEHGALPRQVSFVSGPSRTADIEMTMVLGIHGPYRVHIVLVRENR